VNRLVGRHGLWVGFVAVLLPLGLLLAFQYRWLLDLAATSAAAERSYLRNYLEGVSARVETFYRQQAERSLNLPPHVFQDDDPELVARHFRRKKPDGAKLLFAVNFVAGRWSGILVFDPLTELFGEPADVSMARAVSIALAPWKAASDRGSPLPAQRIVVDEKDPSNRVLINPVTDDGGVLLGVAGMVVDSAYFARELLPAAIRKSLPAARDNLYVTVRDGEGRTVYGSPAVAARTSEVAGRIPFLFSDWTLALGNLRRTPEELARSTFALNLSLSALLALALLGGLTFALRAASRAMRLSRMKSDFVSNVSHELRTPLASIRVFGEFLRLGRADDEAKVREYGEYIETESRRLTRLVNNILDFSRIESGAKRYELLPTDLTEVVAETLASLRVGLEHQGFDVRYLLPPVALPAVRADRQALGQALANLLDNAVKYSGRSRQVSVGLERRNGEVLVTVRDHGIGIAPDEQRRIFDRFHRVSTGLVHDVRGSGLGLSIVSHIARAHGGSVSVDSTPGAGSTFTLHLPVAAGPEERTAADGAGAPGPPPDDR